MTIFARRPAILLRHPTRGFVAVGQGFSWSAFLFGSIWGIVKRAWLVFFCLMLAEIVLWFLSGVATAARDGLGLLGLTALDVAFIVFRGKYANRWLLASLLRRGYERWPAPPA
jgi:hypothetical protein